MARGAGTTGQPAQERIEGSMSMLDFNCLGLDPIENSAQRQKWKPYRRRGYSWSTGIGTVFYCLGRKGEDEDGP